jgi:uncharacterized protein YwgA
MLDVDEMVLTLIDLCGSRSDFGRTTLQKVAYLATVALGWPRVGHQAHFYGPFSRPLERTTARLAGEGLLVEEAEDLSFVGAAGYRAKQFHYRLTEAGVACAAQVRSSRPQDVARLTTFVENLQSSAGGLDQSVLSLAAKVHYIVERHGGLVGHDEIVEAARSLGWRISERKIADVAAILEKLRIVRQS